MHGNKPIDRYLFHLLDVFQEEFSCSEMQLPSGETVLSDPCFVRHVAISTGKCVNLSTPRKSCFYFPLLIFDRWSFWGLSTFLRVRWGNGSTGINDSWSFLQLCEI